jgi:hypothetical protein
MAVATSIIFTFVDDSGDTGRTEIKVPSTFALSDYVEFAQAFGQLLANISNCQVTGASVSVGIDLSSAGLKAVAAAVSNVAAKMAGLWNTATGIIAKWFIPSPHDTQVTAGSDQFDQTDIAIAPIITAMEDGIAVTSGTLQPTNGRGDDVTSVAKLAQQFRRRSPG